MDSSEVVNFYWMGSGRRRERHLSNQVSGEPTKAAKGSHLVGRWGPRASPLQILSLRCLLAIQRQKASSMLDAWV